MLTAKQGILTKPKELTNHKTTTKTKEVFIECLQDGLFFGLDYLKESFKSVEIHSYFTDGACIFKGQTLLGLEWQDISTKESHVDKDVVSLLSYLSGAYTLASCFTGRNFSFSVCAQTTSNFIHCEGEKSALLQAGVFVKPSPENLNFSFNQITQSSKPIPLNLTLSETKMSRSQIKQILTDFSQSFNLHGSFLPADLEEFRNFKNINSVYSTYLEGSFPCLAMRQNS